jgi:hypothetical protein
LAQKNRYLFRGRISERKSRELLRLFALDITADREAVLTGLNHKTAAALYGLLRRRMAELAQQDCPFRGQVELDESYFGPTRQRDRPVFSENGVHINGIESFRSYAKRRHAKFNGLRKPVSKPSSRKPNSASTRAKRTSIRSSSDRAE